MINPLASLVIVCFALIPYTFASASSQFRLDTNTQASKCWVECQYQVTRSFELPNGDDNAALYISKNCAMEQYHNLMPLCLTQLCSSAPDAAYAIEYGKTWCKKAGVELDISLPESYVAAASDYFTSAEYTSRGTRGVKNWGLGDVLLWLTPGAMLLVL